MKIPSDLMIEQLEMASMKLPRGIRNEVRELEHCTLTEVTVEDAHGAAYIGRVRALAKGCCEGWLKSRGHLAEG